MAEFSSLISTLLPLFMSLIEAKKDRLREAMALEVRKVEAQITNDRDKLAWEKEKTIMTINSDMSLREATNRGLLDVEKQRNLGQKDVEEIKARTQEATNKSTTEWQKYHSDALKENAKTTAEGHVTGEALKTARKMTKTGTGETATVTEEFDQGSFDKIQKALGRGPIAATGGESTAAGNFAQAGRIFARELQSTEQRLGKAARDAMFDKLNPMEQAAALAHLQSSGGGTTPGVLPPAAAPAAPAAPAAAPVVSAPGLGPNASKDQTILLPVDRHLRDNPLGGEPDLGEPIIPVAVDPNRGGGSWAEMEQAPGFLEYQAEKAAKIAAAKQQVIDDAKAWNKKIQDDALSARKLRPWATF